jgi:hypothetical protein
MRMNSSCSCGYAAAPTRRRGIAGSDWRRTGQAENVAERPFLAQAPAFGESLGIVRRPDAGRDGGGLDCGWSVLFIGIYRLVFPAVQIVGAIPPI